MTYIQNKSQVGMLRSPDLYEFGNIDLYAFPC